MCEVGDLVVCEGDIRKISRISIVNGQKFYFFEEPKKPYEARAEDTRDLDEQDCCKAILGFEAYNLTNIALSKLYKRFDILRNGN